MKKMLSFLLIGKRFIMISAGYSNRGEDTEIKIGVVTSISIEKHKRTDLLPKIWVGINQYGYDLSEENYIRGLYDWGSYPLSYLLRIYLAQFLLKKLYTKVDLSKNPKDFYPSVRNVEELLN